MSSVFSPTSIYIFIFIYFTCAFFYVFKSWLAEILEAFAAQPIRRTQCDNRRLGHCLLWLVLMNIADKWLTPAVSSFNVLCGPLAGRPRAEGPVHLYKRNTRSISANSNSDVATRWHRQGKLPRNHALENWVARAGNNKGARGRNLKWLTSKDEGI